MILTDVQKINAGPAGKFVVYWLGTDDEPKEMGICFPGDFCNIARQEAAESVCLALDIADKSIRIALDEDSCDV